MASITLRSLEESETLWCSLILETRRCRCRQATPSLHRIRAAMGTRKRGKSMLWDLLSVGQDNLLSLYPGCFWAVSPNPISRWPSRQSGRKPWTVAHPKKRAARGHACRSYCEWSATTRLMLRVYYWLSKVRTALQVVRIQMWNTSEKTDRSYTSLIYKLDTVRTTRSSTRFPFLGIR